jgi:nucleoside-diphosphate-sugar epimerase
VSATGVGGDRAAVGEHPLHADLDEILDTARADLDALAGSRLLLTGGTGFFGAWLVETFAWAAQAGTGPAEVLVLARRPQRLADVAPRAFRSPVLVPVAGDVRRPPTDLGSLDAVIHAATPARASLNNGDPREMLDICVRGTEAMLDLASHSGPVPFLLTSSGAVYGRQDPLVSHVAETATSGPDPLATTNAYAEGKRMAELLGAIAAERQGLQVKVARPFAFAGPHLPLDEHFAAGNFVADAVAGRPIDVNGDGTPMRTYQYPTDLVVSLLAILVRGRTGRAYNVGSDAPVSIADLAEAAAEVGRPPVPVRVHGRAVPGRAPERYVPSIDRLRHELGVTSTVSLPESLRRWARWLYR